MKIDKVITNISIYSVELLNISYINHNGFILEILGVTVDINEESKVFSLLGIFLSKDFLYIRLLWKTFKIFDKMFKVEHKKFLK